MGLAAQDRQDVEFYNQGNVELGKTNITRNIAAQP